ncbi:flagellar hook-associated protein FlgL [Thioclava sp. 15-R06ZXC-3]|uniref:Flagellar hook-associated protein FlgL n=1 Tax=Thioclava arctica TaxID=3238301 RepID=A0ABV3TP50_9RHOB
MDTTFYAMSGQSFTAQETRITELEQQLSSGRKVDTAAADPAAYTGAQEDNSTVQKLDAMNASQVNIKQTLGSATTALGDVSTALNHINSIALQAMNATTSGADFHALGDQVEAGLHQILSLANTQSSNGNYVFSGTAKQTQPFIQTTSGSVNYVGNDGTSSVEISPGVTVNAALSGSIFTKVSTGNGYASVSATSSNSGASTLVASGVVDASAAMAFHDGTSPITVGFSTLADGSKSYTATSGGTTIATGPVDDTEGADTTLTLEGVQFTFSGQPANGDSFTIAPARPQSIFDLVKQIRTALAEPGSTPAARAQTHQILGNALGSLTGYQHQISGASAKVGVILQATNTAANANTQASTNAQTDASNLVSANIPKVLTELQDRTSALQAAMKAFSVASQLTLFKYL